MLPLPKMTELIGNHSQRQQRTEQLFDFLSDISSLLLSSCEINIGIRDVIARRAGRFVLMPKSKCQTIEMSQSCMLLKDRNRYVGAQFVVTGMGLG